MRTGTFIHPPRHFVFAAQRHHNAHFSLGACTADAPGRSVWAMGDSVTGLHAVTFGFLPRKAHP